MNETPDNHPLNDALRALAETDAQHEAAPRVEALLLTAFRQQHAEEKVSIASPPAPSSVRSLVWSSLFARGSYALAAAALLFIGFAWWNWRAAEIVPKQKPEVAISSPTPAPMNEAAPIEIVEQQRIQFVAQRKPLTRRVTTKPAVPIAAPIAGPIAAVEEEIATEFFPLVNENALPERGQLRRVSVPRSTLINFGLPVNAERLEIPINADLLVGEDGGARAIRFVQDRFPSETFINNGFNNQRGRPLPAAYRNNRR